MRLWHVVSQRASDAELRHCGLWLAGRDLAWVGTTATGQGLQHELWLVAKWAPQRLVAAFCALDTALRTGGPAFRAAVNVWAVPVFTALQLAVLTPEAAADMETLVTMWASLGFLHAHVLGIRWWRDDVHETGIQAGIQAGTSGTTCGICGAAFRTKVTFDAHCAAHVRGRAQGAAIAARRPSRLRVGAIAKAIAAVRDSLPAPRGSPVPCESAGHGMPVAAACCICGDVLAKKFDDGLNTWAWVDAYENDHMYPGRSRPMVHIGCADDP
jgi:hypothetical protein